MNKCEIPLKGAVLCRHPVPHPLPLRIWFLASEAQHMGMFLRLDFSRFFLSHGAPCIWFFRTACSLFQLKFLQSCALIIKKFFSVLKMNCLYHNSISLILFLYAEAVWTIPYQAPCSFQLFKHVTMQTWRTLRLLFSRRNIFNINKCCDKICHPKLFKQSEVKSHICLLSQLVTKTVRTAYKDVKAFFSFFFQ